MALGKGMKYQIDLLANNKSGAALKKFKGDISSVHNQVARLGATIAAAFGTREIVQAANVMIGVENRMNALTGSATATAAAMDSMKRIAMESRSDFDSVAMLYTRLALATEHLGTTQDQLADATQMVANTFIIAGSHTQEANNSARQLAQGLASGALRGDELRSVMENNVILTKMLAKGLNMTVGELREFGHAGGLTAEKVLPILIAGVEETNEKIADMPMTLGQAGVSIRNSFQFMIGDIQKSTNAFGIIADAAAFFARNIQEILIPAITLLAATAIPKLISSLRLLKIAMLANPITAVAVGFAALASMVMMASKNTDQYADSVEGLNQKLADLQKREEELLKAKEENAKRFGRRQQQKELDAIQEEITQTEILIEAKKILNDTNLDGTDAYLEALKKVQEETNNSIVITKTFGETIEGKLTNAYLDFFDITSQKFLEFKTLAMSVTQAVIRELLQVYVVQKLVAGITSSIDNFMAGGSSQQAAALTQSIPELNPIPNTTVIGNRALGGSVNAGKSYMVGESGRELFIPNKNGQIVSNQDLEQIGTAQSAPTVNFNISTVDAAGFDQLLASRKGLITSIINNAMNNQGKMGVV
jgi:tape measure domain-containing protein